MRFVIFQKSPLLFFPTHFFRGGRRLNLQNPEKVIITGTYMRIWKEMVIASLKAAIYPRHLSTDGPMKGFSTDSRNGGPAGTLYYPIHIQRSVSREGCLAHCSEGLKLQQDLSENFKSQQAKDMSTTRLNDHSHLPAT